MKKRAGSFFKNVMNKGKNLFNNKKDEEETKEGNNDFDSEEDTDIIEVGKKSSAPSHMPSNSLITSNHGSGGMNNSNA
jgi:hypothetical protein